MQVKNYSTDRTHVVLRKYWQKDADEILLVDDRILTVRGGQFSALSGITASHTSMGRGSSLAVALRSSSPWLFSIRRAIYNRLLIYCKTPRTTSFCCMVNITAIRARHPRCFWRSFRCSSAVDIIWNYYSIIIIFAGKENLCCRRSVTTRHKPTHTDTHTHTHTHDELSAMCYTVNWLVWNDNNTLIMSRMSL